MISRVWVVMFSKIQNAIHVESLEETVNVSFRQLKTNRFNDYLVVGAFSEESKAGDYARKFKDVYKETLNIK